MQALDLNDPQKFVMADIVTKNSKSKQDSTQPVIGYKERASLLLLVSSEKLQKQIRQYEDEIKFLESYHQLPKCSIEILNIKKINGFQNSSNYFSIEFEARHMMERQDIRKTMTLQEFNFAPKNKKQTITWQFTCDSQNIKQKWVSTLQSLHAHYSKEKVNIQKFFDNINKKEQEKEQNSQPAIRSSMKVPWREDQIKKSSSNESLTKNLRNSQINHSPSLSNGKKSATSNSNSEKNEPRQANKLKLLSPQSEEDLVQTFMKIQKTKSLHEPVESLSIKEQNQDVSETLRQSNYQNNQPKFHQSPPINEKHENIFAKKQVGELQVSKFQISEVKETTANFSEDKIQIQKEKKVESPIRQMMPEPTKRLLEPENKKASIPKIESAPFQQPRALPYIRRTISLQERNQLITKSTSIQYRVDFNTNFYELLYFSQNRQYSFDKRIEAQKKLNTLVGNFTDKCVKSYAEFINSKAQNSGNSSRFAEDRINEGLSTLQIGYSRYKIGYVTTQAVTINGKQKIFYNQSTVKQIKRQISVYNQLFTIISQHLKNMNKTNPLNTQASLSLSLSRSQTYSQNQQSSTNSLNYPDIVYPSHLKVSVNQLRVPLCTYVEYKGICAMAYDESHKNKETEIVDKEKLNQWRDLLRFLGFNSACFDFRTMDTNVGEVVIAYIVRAGNDIYLNSKQEKHHNVTFSSPINVQFIKKAKKEGASTSTQSLLRYLKGVQSLKDTQLFTCPRQQITTTLEYCYLLKYLRKFYRASHAQIDELKFVNLLLKGDSNMNKLFQTSSFEYQPNKPGATVLGIFFEFLLYYLGINCIVDAESFSKYASLGQIGISSKQQNTNRVNCVKQVKLVPRVVGLCLDGLQLYQTFSKIDYYIGCKSKQLASKALQYKQGTFFQNSFQLCSYPWPASCQCLFALAQLNYIENDYITSIAKCKQFLYTMLSTSDEDENQQDSHQIPAPSCCIPIYFLMIKCYSKFSRDKFNETLRLVIQSTIYNYGEHSSMMITLFSFVALVFCGVGQYSQAQNYLKIAINQAEKLYRLYSKSKVSELYLDLSRVLLQQNKIGEYNQYLSRTENIVQSKGSYSEKINLLLYILETSVKIPKSIEWEQKAIQAIYRTDKILKKQQSSMAVIKQYYSLQYQIGMKYKKNQIYQAAIEELWKLDTSSKILAVQYCYRLVGHQFQDINSRHQSILQKWSLSKEKSLLKIEENVNNYKNLLDMMTEVFTEEDEDLVSAFVRVLPEELFLIKPTI